MQFIPFEEPRIRPTPPATVQLREPIFMPEAALAGKSAGRGVSKARKAAKDLKFFMVLSWRWLGEIIIARIMAKANDSDATGKLTCHRLCGYGLKKRRERGESIHVD